jgi:pilus assembly protein CpaE
MGGTNAGATASALVFIRDDEARTVAADAIGGGSSTVSRPGGVEEAVDYLSYDPSPRILVLDISGISDPLTALDRLAEVCMPGTRVIAVGETNDIQFYRKLRAAGVTEYLVKPLSAEAIKAALETAQEKPPAPEPPKTDKTGKADLIVVVGARGGVGATMVAVSLAHFSADRMSRRTALVDLDITAGSAALALDADTGYGLVEALSNPDRIDSLLIASATTRVNENLLLLASEQNLGTTFTFPPDATEHLLKGVLQEFRRAVLDVPRWNGAALRSAFKDASAIVIVTDFSLAGVRDTTRLIQLARSVAPQTKRLVVGNRMTPKKSSDLNRAEIEKAIAEKLAVAIPEEPAAVANALNSGKPVPAAAPNSAVTGALSELAQMLENGEINKPQKENRLTRLLAGRTKGAKS